MVFDGTWIPYDSTVKTVRLLLFCLLEDVGKWDRIIENMYMICNEKVEAIEFIVDENTKNLNKKFKDITISDDIIYATIVRDDKIIIPTGDDCLKINDKVIVVSQNKKFEEIIFGGDK